jgi:GT2 family glycosyltransferase
MTAECLASVLANDYEDFRVLLVDNGSRAPCGERLKARFPEIELLVLPVNQGFAGGANRGLERGFEMGAEYVQVIGNDGRLAPDAIRRLVAALDADRRAGAAGPLILSTDPDPVVHFYRASVDRDRAHHHHYDAGVPLRSRSWPTVENPFVPFVAMMFRRQALADVGLMDESFCTSWEDYDLCLRLVDRGWRLLLVGDAHVFHRVRGTTGVHSPYITYYRARNRLICLFRHGRPLRSLGTALGVARSLYHHVRAYGLRNWTCHRAFARGIFDYAMGVRGVGNPPADLRG